MESIHITTVAGRGARCRPTSAGSQQGWPTCYLLLHSSVNPTSSLFNKPPQRQKWTKRVGFTGKMFDGDWRGSSHSTLNQTWSWCRTLAKEEGLEMKYSPACGWCTRGDSATEGGTWPWPWGDKGQKFLSSVWRGMKEEPYINVISAFTVIKTFKINEVLLSEWKCTCGIAEIN